MQNDEFIEYCTTQLKQVFHATKQGKPNLKLKHQTEGLLRAGELLGVVSRAQAFELMERTHLEVFGVTAEQRAQRKQTLIDIKASMSDDFFDIPAIQRKQQTD